jgi:carboxymethylenebutenolidase
MTGKMVEFPVNGRTAPGYLATPKGGSGPALIVIQEWWGLVRHIEDVTDRFAAEGFVALAPDLFHGDKAKSSDEAGHLLMGLDIPRATADIGGAAKYLLAQPGVTSKKAAIVGFCMGGQLALLGGCEHPDTIGPTVNFYGVHPKAQLRPERLTSPVLAHFAKQDGFVTGEVADELVQRIVAAGKQVIRHDYDADHAFFNDTRPEVYSAECSKLAWERTLSFLREHHA